jgi:GT2 family glycosyltransferase
MTRNISIIIVSFNTREILCKCLDSMSEYLAEYDHEIIVVDNASSDGTQEHLKNNYESIALIENNTNEGFAKAVNTGLSRATGRVIGLINSDIIFIEDVFSKILNIIDNDDKIGVVGCKLLNQDRTIQKSAYRSYPGFLEEIVEYGGLSGVFDRLSIPVKYSLTVEEHNVDREVAHLKGACLFLRREIIEDVGYFDERFFMYREETDFCKRTHDCGWKVYLLSSASVVHLHKISSDKLEDKGIKYRLSSHYSYLLKHRGRLEASLLYAIILITSFIKWLFIKVKGGDGRYYMNIVKWHLGLRDI